MIKYCPSHNHTIIGIDPANDGSLVVLVGTSIPIVFLWKKVTRKKKRVFQVKVSYENSNNVKTQICRTSSHIGQFISSFPEVSTVTGISIEDCYLARNVKTTISLARFAGSVSAPLVNKCGFDPKYVKPTEWRKRVLNMNKRVKREQAKEASLKYIPLIVPAINHHLSMLGMYDHITDALGIAIWLSSQK